MSIIYLALRLTKEQGGVHRGLERLLHPVLGGDLPALEVLALLVRDKVVVGLVDLVEEELCLVVVGAEDVVTDVAGLLAAVDGVVERGLQELFDVLFLDGK